ncbi:hypothetical protein ACIOKD_12580 [Streptomyces sp. NPDC087844]|uniref:hypothetical protein n=1 Tax=Streptomyces sp. NPDC087844 TaxID=3365805 RepID=UPI00381D1036
MPVGRGCHGAAGEGDAAPDLVEAAVDVQARTGDEAALLGARFVTTFGYGIAVQAASGVGRDGLQEMADAALRNRPPL